MAIKCAVCFRLFIAFEATFFYVIPCNAIVNQCWDSDGKAPSVGLSLIVLLAIAGLLYYLLVIV